MLVFSLALAIGVILYMGGYASIRDRQSEKLEIFAHLLRVGFEFSLMFLGMSCLILPAVIMTVILDLWDSWIPLASAGLAFIAALVTMFWVIPPLVGELWKERKLLLAEEKIAAIAMVVIFTLMAMAFAVSSMVLLFPLLSHYVC